MEQDWSYRSVTTRSPIIVFYIVKKKSLLRCWSFITILFFKSFLASPQNVILQPHYTSILTALTIATTANKNLSALISVHCRRRFYFFCEFLLLFFFLSLSIHSIFFFSSFVLLFSSTSWSPLFLRLSLHFILSVYCVYTYIYIPTPELSTM